MTIPDVEAVIITVGEPSYAECIRRVQSLTPKPVAVRIVRHISPVHLAMQSMVYGSDFRYVLQVDADMLLNPDAAIRLRVQIGDDSAMACGWLMGDIEERPVGHVKMYNTELISKHSLNFYNVPDCDAQMTTDIRNAGLGIAMPKPADEVMGHHVAVPPSRAYSRYFGLARRFLKHERKYRWAADVVSKWRNQAVAGQVPLTPGKVAGLMGWAAGLAATHSDEGESYKRPAPGLNKLMELDIL